jgi:hypothetical protein
MILLKRFLSSKPPPTKEWIDAINKLTKNLKVENVAKKMARLQNTTEARDMRALVKKRLVEIEKGHKYSESDLQTWFIHLDEGKIPDNATDEEIILFKRLFENYKLVF